jgi:ankyrin repeat protein
MSLVSLVNELLLSIADHLTCARDINALVRTNRRLYSSLNLFLYRYAVQQSNHSALHWAAYHGHSNTLLMLLDVGADVRAPVGNNKGLTALHVASAKGHLIILEILIQSGADVNAQTSAGITPLCKAVSNGFECITRLLIENGAGFMTTRYGPNKSTLLHIASFFGFTTIVQLLLEKGMAIEVKDADLQTPLHYAVKGEGVKNVGHGNLRTVKFLLEHNANKDAWDGSGRRPKVLAKGNSSNALGLLLQNSSDISVDDAILLEQRRQMKKEQDQAKKLKKKELAAERTARQKADETEKQRLRKAPAETREQQYRVEREREREKLAKISKIEEEQDAIRQNWAEIRVEADKEQQLRRERAAARKQQQDCARNEEPADTSRQEKQAATRQAWAQTRAEAEQNSRRPSRPTGPSPCSHPALGWLKRKGRAQCDMCGSACAKSAFRCGDCGRVACLPCKTSTVHSNA